MTSEDGLIKGSSASALLTAICAVSPQLPYKKSGSSEAAML